MKLNPDCVRDILLLVESETTAIHKTAYPSPEFETLDEKYTPEVVLYHVVQCIEHEYFCNPQQLSKMNFSIPDLSPKGHEFLANIRKDTVWNGVKDIAGKIGVSSLSALTQISSNIVLAFIKDYFHLNV